MIDVEKYSNKTVSFNFMAKSMKFKLSQALFSSFDIDSGSKLLLKSIAKTMAGHNIKTILDIGSGVGVLGIACAKAFPEAKLYMRDRDAIACEFSKHNAVLNGIVPKAVDHAIFYDGLKDMQFDMIVCNVPAKAGEPVLDAFLHNVPALLTEHGVACFVFINAIANAALASLTDANVEIIFTEKTHEYTALLIKKQKSEPHFYDLSLEAMNLVRSQKNVMHDLIDIDGYWSLPEFDSASFDTELLIQLYKQSVSGIAINRAAIINPGIGVFASYLQNEMENLAIDICSKDILSLYATSQNLLKKISQQNIATHAFNKTMPDSSFDILIERPVIEPGIDMVSDSWECAARILKNGAAYIVATKSSYMARFEKKRTKSFTRVASRKKNGFTCSVWRYDTK